MRFQFWFSVGFGALCLSLLTHVGDPRDVGVKFYLCILTLALGFFAGTFGLMAASLDAQSQKMAVKQFTVSAAGVAVPFLAAIAAVIVLL